MDKSIDPSFYETENSLEPDWSKDPRCKTYWNARGKIFICQPISETHVILVDAISGGEIKMSNSEVRFEEKQGNLIEFNPRKPHQFPAGGTSVRREPIQQGKYSANMGVMKRLLEEGKKVVPEKEVKDPEFKPAAPLAGKYAKKS